MLKLEHEFLDPGDAKGDQVRASWGRLAISLNGVKVTRCISGADTVRESIYGPLYPIAEWLAARWWSILYELDNGANSREPLYARRHDLLLAEEGFALPRLWFQSRGSDVHVISYPFKHPTIPIEFTEPRADAIIPAEELEGLLGDFISAVANRLTAKGVANTTLHADWKAIVNTTKDEKAFCIAAARLGLDPFDLPDPIAEAIEAAGTALPVSVHEDLFALAGSKDLGAWTKLVAQLLKTTKRNITDTSALDNLQKALTKTRIRTDVPGYVVGYARAEKVRSLLKLNGDLLSTHNDLLDAFSLEADAASTAHTWEQQGLRGALAYGDKGTPVFVLNKRANDRSQRFAMARAIHEHLFHSGTSPRIITEVRSVDQSISRSFAAELLLPKRELSKRITTKVVYGEQVDAFADEFGVETDVVRYHIKNHKLAEVEELAL